MPLFSKEAEPIGIKASACLDPDRLDKGGGPDCCAALIRASKLSVALASGRWTDAAS